jgi:hypothetical protein
MMHLKPYRKRQKFCSKRCNGEGVTLRPTNRQHNGRVVKIDTHGYVMVWEPTHPNNFSRGWIYEHRLVAERTIGRYLRSDEHVHHINGIKDDNRPENLEVMDGIAHAALSARDYRDGVARKLAELEEYRRRFGDLK